MSASPDLDVHILEKVFTYASGLDLPLDWIRRPDYATLRSCAVVCRSWRHPAQACLARHVRIASPEAMSAIRTREAKRMLEQHKTVALDVENQFGMEVYWLLDRFTKGLKALRIVYDPLRGAQDWQGERDEEWLTWDVLRHPSLTGITNLNCEADLQDPDDLSLLPLPVTDLTLGCLPLEHAPGLHKALFTGCRGSLRNISLAFTPTLTPPKPALDSLIEEFQVVAPSLEYLAFLNKPNIDFLMSLHSKMNATKMPLFYSCTFPLVPNALAPFNILALAVVNNGTSLAEFRFAEVDPLHPVDQDTHEALILKYLNAFGSRLDSFNMLGRRFKFVFPRQWPAQFVKRPEIARFLDRAGARGCDVECGGEQRFASTAKAMEKRKGKRVAADGGGGDESPSPEEEARAALEQVVQQAAAAKKGKGKGKAVDKGKGKAVDKGKGKAVDKGKGKAAF
ncbi:hypothetical protein JCM10207_003021 [Rhodosporidiobolus poonsookiae]